jgi:hypothetical protein
LTHNLFAKAAATFADHALMSSDKREVLIEIITVGAYAKVSAIDAETGTEVSVTAPANLDELILREAAIKKLEYVLKKKRDAG